MSLPWRPKREAWSRCSNASARPQTSARAISWQPQQRGPAPVQQPLSVEPLPEVWQLLRPDLLAQLRLPVSPPSWDVGRSPRSWRRPFRRERKLSWDNGLGVRICPILGGRRPVGNDLHSAGFESGSGCLWQELWQMCEVYKLLPWLVYKHFFSQKCKRIHQINI